MIERGRGSVINLASIAGVMAVRDRLAYTITKHAVVGLTKSLALDHSHTGVRFNTICPDVSIRRSPKPASRNRWTQPERDWKWRRHSLTGGWHNLTKSLRRLFTWRLMNPPWSRGRTL
jgi:NAD(P)-dependent dehydrogenase (short-subunit alcohol dehydrogenase family)